MENVTTGHWIFAGVFMTAFIIYLIYSYRKDLKLHKVHYSGSMYVLAAIVIFLFLFYVIKQFLEA